MVERLSNESVTPSAAASVSVGVQSEAAGKPPPAESSVSTISLMVLPDSVLQTIFDDYADFRDLAAFSVALACQPPRHTGSFLRVPLHSVCLSPAHAEHATAASLVLVRRHFRVEGLRFDFRWRRPRARSPDPAMCAAPAPGRVTTRFGVTEWDHDRHAAGGLRLSNMDEVARTENSERAVVRRLHYLVAAFDECRCLAFDVSPHFPPSHMSKILKNVAHLLAGGFGARIDAIKVPALHKLAGGAGGLAPSILRMLIDSASDLFPTHPLDAEGFLALKRLPPRTREQRLLDSAIEQLYYQLPNARSRRLFARQLFCAVP